MTTPEARRKHIEHKLQNGLQLSSTETAYNNLTVANNALKAMDGFASAHDFIRKFYNSPDHSSKGFESFVDGAHNTASVLSSWDSLAAAASVTVRTGYHSALVDAAAGVLDREMEACQYDRDLNVNAEKLDRPRLASIETLDGLSSWVETRLPLFVLLLRRVGRAPNRSDKSRPDGGISGRKRKLNPPIRLAILSMLLYLRNRGANLFQTLFAMYASACAVPATFQETLSHLGLSISPSSVRSAWTSLTRTNHASFLERFGPDSPHPFFFIDADNLDHQLPVSSCNERINSYSDLLHMSYAAIRPIPSRIDPRTFSPAGWQEVWALRGKGQEFDLSSLALGPEHLHHAAAAQEVAMLEILIDSLPSLNPPQPSTAAARLRKSLHAELDLLAEALPLARPLEASPTKSERFPIGALDHNLGEMKGAAGFMEELRDLFQGEEAEDGLKAFIGGDWLTWRNIMLAARSRAGDDEAKARFDHVASSFYPFHYVLLHVDSTLALHHGNSPHSNPIDLHNCSILIRKGKVINMDHVDYDSTRHLIRTSVAAGMLDHVRVASDLTLDQLVAFPVRRLADVRRLVANFVDRFGSFRRLANTLQFVPDEEQDQVRIFDARFAHTVLLEVEYDRAVRAGDVGSMREVLRQWVMFFKSVGATNYANGVMEMFVEEMELPPERMKLREASWLVNLTGTKKGYEAADRLVEHDIGAIKAAIANTKGNFSIDYIRNTLSGNCDVRRHLISSVPAALGFPSASRPHHSLPSHTEIHTLLVNRIDNNVLINTPRRRIDPPRPPPAKPLTEQTQEVRDAQYEKERAMAGTACKAGQGSGIVSHKTNPLVDHVALGQERWESKDGVGAFFKRREVWVRDMGIRDSLK